MAGAIAGTAILNAGKLTKNLHTITLTINDQCNLHCPHCYLQYKSTNKLASIQTVENILKSNFEHLAIVGHEPLLNTSTIKLIDYIVEGAKLNSITVSLVTNGINLRLLSKNTVKHLDYVDISFDGGLGSYEQYRKANFRKLILGLDHIQKSGIKKINALHTLHTENIHYIDDMISINQFANFANIMFSPYLVTENHGKNSVSAVHLIEIINQLKKSKSFKLAKNSFLLIDIFHLAQESIDLNFVKQYITKINFKDKVQIIEHDPLYHGIIRVTFDNLILTPSESLHTKHYKKSIYHASSSNLNMVYKQFLKRNQKHEHQNAQFCLS